MNVRVDEPIAVLDPSTSSVVSNYGSTMQDSLHSSQLDVDYKHKPSFAEHLGKHRQYWRDIILGINDGLVSTFLLVAGVAGGGLSSNDILLTAIAGALAGAVSMAAGEFVATKSQDEVIQGEIALEHRHISEHLDDEVQELGELLDLIGIPEDQAELRESICAFYENNPDALLKIMVALEFGVLEEERRIPWKAGATSCLLFFVGALPSVVPFACTAEPGTGLLIAGLATSAMLCTVGAVKTWASRGKWLVAAVENLAIAGAGGVLAYGVGAFFDLVLH